MKYCVLKDLTFIYADVGNFLLMFTIGLGITGILIASFVPQQIPQTGIVKNAYCEIDCNMFFFSVVSMVRKIQYFMKFNDFVFRVQASLSFHHLVEWVWKAPWGDLQFRYSEYRTIIVLYHQR